MHGVNHKITFNKRKVCPNVGYFHSTLMNSLNKFNSTKFCCCGNKGLRYYI